MTALGDFSPGDVLTAADLNAIGTWTDYTPSCSWSSYGNFDFVKYARFNDVVILKFKFDLTGTPTGAGDFAFDLPVVDTDAYAGAVGSCALFDATGLDYVGLLFSSSDDMKATAFPGGNVDPTQPFTWGSSDSIRGVGIIEVQ